MIELKNIRVAYDKNFLCEGNMVIYPNQITLLKGENGTGKTSLLYQLGLLTKICGEYYLDGKALHHYPEKEKDDLRRYEIGYVFQTNSMLDYLTLYENFEHIDHLINQKRDKNKIEEFLNQLNINEDLSKYPSELSGGQKQRLAIALALYKQPQLLILDEPTSNLDSKNKKLVMDLLLKIKQQNIMIVIVTHDEEFDAIADHIYRIENKTIQEIKPAISVETEQEQKKRTNALNLFWYVVRYMRFHKKIYIMITLLIAAALGILAGADHYFNQYASQIQQTINSSSANEIYVMNLSDIEVLAPIKDRIQSLEQEKTFQAETFDINDLTVNDTLKIGNYTPNQALYSQDQKQLDHGKNYVSFEFAIEHHIEKGDRITFDSEQKEYQFTVDDILYPKEYGKYDLYIHSQNECLIPTDNYYVYSEDIHQTMSLLNDISILDDEAILSCEYQKIVRYTDMLETVTVAVQIFNGVISTLCLLSLMLIFYRQTVGRTHEFAILMANGLTRRQILWLSLLTNMLILLITDIVTILSIMIVSEPLRLLAVVSLCHIFPLLVCLVTTNKIIRPYPSDILRNE